MHTKEHRKKMREGMRRWLKKKWNCNFVEDKWIPLLGKIPDRELAEKAGVTPQAIFIKRNKLGIPSYRSNLRVRNQAIRERNKKMVVILNTP